MNNINRIFTIVLAVVILAVMPSCAKVGSKRWCAQMEKKSAADWTPREAKDYATHCVLESSD